MQWVKIRSFHAIRTPTRGGTWRTYCGRDVPMAHAEVRDALPAQRSCEACLRIIARLEP